MSRLTVVLVTLAGCGASVGTAPEDPPEAPARILKAGCAGSPYTRIQDAIDAAAANDVIEVCAGTYEERLVVSRKAVTIRSKEGPTATVVDAEGAGRALDVVDGADVVVEGLTFQSGVAEGARGGNVRCLGADLVVRNNVFEDGDAFKGGGLAYTSCGGLIEGNTFRDNHTPNRGGALYLEGSIDIVGNTFEGNVSELDAGAVYVRNGWGLIRGNTVRMNVAAEDDGGGIFVYDGAPWVDANRFEDNESGEEGGALRIKSSKAMITDNTFIGNHADWRGGAAKISHNESVMAGNTYIDNTSSGDAGAVLLFESASDLSFEYFENNRADDGGAIAVIEGWRGPTIEDSTFVGNSADRGGHLFIELLARRVQMRRVDLVAGAADEGGAVYSVAGSDIDFRNVLFADNAASVAGGALSLDATVGELYNSVVIWNTAPDGAALRVTNGVVGLDVRNSVFAENTGGAAIRNTYTGLVPAPAPAFSFNDFYQNTLNFWGMASVVGLGGNLAAPTGFVNALAGDFTLLPSSSLENAGDPQLDDPDGTRSDIGLYGGPHAF